MTQYKRIKRELQYKGRIIEVYKDTIEVPNGNITCWDTVHHKGAAAVIPVMEDGRIIMVRQYRGPLDKEMLEIPAGGLNHEGESGLSCASRELEEETGYRSEDIKHLITIYTTVGFCDEKIEIFIANNLIESKQNLDENEFVSLEYYSVEELKKKIFAGEIEDSKTVSAILAYDNVTQSV
jgi:NTP pyrophosphohydrolases including oxidative damage repair enzymes